MEQNIRVMYAWKIYSPITISFRFFPLPAVVLRSSEAFNGTSTDINRSRDEWRLTLKYYASRLLTRAVVVGDFFRSFFSLNHLTDQVHAANMIRRWNQHNINDLIKERADGLRFSPRTARHTLSLSLIKFLFSTICCQSQSFVIEQFFSFDSSPPELSLSQHLIESCATLRECLMEIMQSHIKPQPTVNWKFPQIYFRRIDCGSDWHHENETIEDEKSQER